MAYNFGSTDFYLDSEALKRIIHSSFQSPFVLD